MVFTSPMRCELSFTSDLVSPRLSGVPSNEWSMLPDEGTEMPSESVNDAMKDAYRVFECDRAWGSSADTACIGEKPLKRLAPNTASEGCRTHQ